MPPIHEVTRAWCRTGTGMPDDAVPLTCPGCHAMRSGQADRNWAPGRLFGDLLTFAEAHHLPVHGAQVIRDRLQRGFWRHVRSDRPSRPV